MDEKLTIPLTDEDRQMYADLLARQKRVRQAQDESAILATTPALRAELIAALGDILRAAHFLRRTVGQAARQPLGPAALANADSSYADIKSAVEFLLDLAAGDEPIDITVVS